MGTAIHIENCIDIVIENFTAINCTTAVHAENTRLLRINGLNTKECTKGVVLNNCWDSDLKNLNIENNKNKHFFQEKLLYQLVKYFMYRKS
jgi:hypothetical protein